MDPQDIKRMQRVDTPAGPATVEIAATARSDGRVQVWLDAVPAGLQADPAVSSNPRQQVYDACDVHSRAHARHDNDDGGSGLVARLTREGREMGAMPNGCPL